MTKLMKPDWLLIVAFTFLASCGGGSDQMSSTTEMDKIVVTVSGLDGTLVLQNNVGDDLEITEDVFF